jgi:hypothetical protein
MAPRVFTHYNHHHVLPSSYVIKPAGEKASVRNAGAAAHFVWLLSETRRVVLAAAVDFFEAESGALD